jgi:MFS family permease
MDLSSEIYHALLPAFVTMVLGLPATALGAIDGIAEATANFAKLGSGRLSDRSLKRKPWVMAGYGIAALSKPLFPLATSAITLMAARFADRIGKGIRGSPRDAMVADETPPEIRGRAFGFHRAADTAGAVIGPLLGLALYEAFDHHLRPLFFFAAIPAALSVLFIARVREHPPRPVEKLAAQQPAPPVAALPARYWRVVIVLAVFALANFSDALLILRAQELGLGFVAIILVYTLYNVTYAGLSLPAGIVSDRIPRRIVYSVGLLIFAVAYLGLGLANSSAWVWVLLPVYGAYTALTDGVGKSWVVDLLPAELVGTGLGLFQGLTGGCALIASVWAGLAWGDDGHVPLVASGAVVGVLALAMLVGGRALADAA